MESEEIVLTLMDRYTPLWSKIVDSSIWSEPYYVRVLFVTMMAMKDRDHVVRFDAYALARRANMTEKEVLDALKVLASPDRKKLEHQDHEGRRILKVDDGWLMLNAEKYQRLMYLANRREYQRQKQAEYRSRKNKGSNQRERVAVNQFEEGAVDQNFQPV